MPTPRRVPPPSWEEKDNVSSQAGRELGFGEGPGTGISPLCKFSPYQSKTLWPLRAAQGVAAAHLERTDGSLSQNTPHHQHIPGCGVAAAPFPSPRGLGASSRAETPAQSSQASSATSHPMTPEGPTWPAQTLATITLPQVPPSGEASHSPGGAAEQPPAPDAHTLLARSAQGCLQPAPALPSTRSTFPTSPKSQQEL